MYNVDELQIYRGRDIKITDKIIITQPTLDQIEKFGEHKYFNSVHILTSVGADLKWQLWDYYNIDYTTIDDYKLFTTLICNMLSSKKNIYKELMDNKELYKEELKSFNEDDLNDLLVNPLELILKDIDLANFRKYKNIKNNQIELYDKENNITINRAIYNQIVDIVRKIHGFKRNNEIPANERTKMDLIDDARDEAMLNSKRQQKSFLKPLVSTLTVKCGLCGDDKIWNMKICNFFDNIKRITKIQDTTLLLQGAYSGFASLKGIDKNRLDYFSEL